MTKFILALIVLVAVVSGSIFIARNRLKSYWCSCTYRPESEASAILESQKESNITPVRCNLSARDPAQENRYQDLLHLLRDAVQETRELPHGYAFRFPAESTLCLAAAEFITMERQCCSFFNFVIEMEANEGPLWIRVTGSDCVKKFLKDQLADLLKKKTSP